MTTPQIPKTQQDALPIQTIAAANSGDIQVVGNTISKFWSGPALNMGNSVSEAANFSYYSNQLDVRGCWRFALVLTYTTTGAIWPAITTLNLFWLYGSSGGLFPTLVTPGVSFIIRMNNAGAPALPVASSQVITLTWCDGGPQPTNQAAGGMATIGTSFKLCLQANVNTPAGGTLVGELWGSS